MFLSSSFRSKRSSSLRLHPLSSGVCDRVVVPGFLKPRPDEAPLSRMKSSEKLHFFLFVAIRGDGIIAWESLEARNGVLLPGENPTRSDLRGRKSPDGAETVLSAGLDLAETVLMLSAVSLVAMPPAPFQAPRSGQ